MHCPPVYYQLLERLTVFFPGLEPAQRRGLAWWVAGTVLARSGGQSAVIAALLAYGKAATIRQRLREWTYAGPERDRPTWSTLTVATCFVPLLRWVLSWWDGTVLPLALDVTYQRDRWAVIAISVLYRGSAIPVAWQVLPANQQGAWLPTECRLLRQLAPAIPARWTVLVLTDRGLWSPTLWRTLKRLGWQPVMRVRGETTCAPAGERRGPARQLVPGPGYAWVGRGAAFKPAKRVAGTLVVVWANGQDEPWIILTTLPPVEIGVTWYGLRMWIEAGFRVLKRLGWNWQHTRRTDPDRVARHWLVLAVATLWAIAYGTRVDDALQTGQVPGRLRQPPPTAPATTRQHSLFCLGLNWMQRAWWTGRWWRRLWLVPTALPDPPSTLRISYHPDPTPDPSGHVIPL